MVVGLGIFVLLYWIAQYYNWSSDLQFAFVFAGSMLTVIAHIALRDCFYGGKKEEIHTERQSCVTKVVATDKAGFKKMINSGYREWLYVEFKYENTANTVNSLLELVDARIIEIFCISRDGSGFFSDLVELSAKADAWHPLTNPLILIAQNKNAGDVILSKIGNNIKSISNKKPELKIS